MSQTVGADHPRIGFVASSAVAVAATLQRALRELKTQKAAAWEVRTRSTAVREHCFEGQHKLPEAAKTETTIYFRASALLRPTRDGGVKTAALFSGQGGQYPYMMDELAMNWPVGSATGACASMRRRSSGVCRRDRCVAIVACCLPPRHAC